MSIRTNSPSSVYATTTNSSSPPSRVCSRRFDFSSAILRPDDVPIVRVESALSLIFASDVLDQKAIRVSGLVDAVAVSPLLFVIN